MFNFKKEIIMGILTLVLGVSILTMLIFFILLLVGLPISKPTKIIGYIITLPVFFGAMLLISTMGEIERLKKEKLEKYEEITYTIYKKK
jgi:cobalamin biosynthesis protein CobD/CbiB